MRPGENFAVHVNENRKIKIHHAYISILSDIHAISGRDPSGGVIQPAQFVVENLWSCLKDCGLLLYDDLQVAKSAVSRGLSNRHVMYAHDSPESPTGAGMFVLSSLINHSCDPNLVQDITISARTTTRRPIKRGEQLTVS